MNTPVSHNCRSGNVTFVALLIALFLAVLVLAAMSVKLQKGNPKGEKIEMYPPY